MVSGSNLHLTESNLNFEFFVVINYIVGEFSIEVILLEVDASLAVHCE